LYGDALRCVRRRRSEKKSSLEGWLRRAGERDRDGEVPSALPNRGEASRSSRAQLRVTGCSRLMVSAIETRWCRCASICANTSSESLSASRLLLGVAIVYI
jgi:hypothetical protein